MTAELPVNGTVAANAANAGREADSEPQVDRGDGLVNGISDGGTSGARVMEEGMSVLLDVNGEKQSFAYLGRERYE